MIVNSICPYCRSLMVRAENQENSRSVEHLIPNAALTRKRKNDEGDFYACRKCNSRKSHIDYILGTIAKCQVDNNEIAANTLIKAITKKDDGSSKRFIQMIQNFEEQPDGVHMALPIKGRELVEYIEFLGKGQYFKKHKIPFNPDKNVFSVGFINKSVIKPFQKWYKHSHKTNCFRDLEKNKYSEIITDGECIIYSKNKNYMFVFHDYIVITIKVLTKNRKNVSLCSKRTERLIKDFR